MPFDAAISSNTAIAGSRVEDEALDALGFLLREDAHVYENLGRDPEIGASLIVDVVEGPVARKGLAGLVVDEPQLAVNEPQAVPCARVDA